MWQDAAKAQASSSASDVRTSAPPGPQQKPKAEARSELFEHVCTVRAGIISCDCESWLMSII